MTSRTTVGMNHETNETMAKRRKPFTVDYTGFGWVLIKHGVFEDPKMEYPWFAPMVNSGEFSIVERTFRSLDAIEAGYEIWCDRIRVGEKTGLSDDK